MARTFGKVYVSMWAEDEHFRSLSKDAKLCYTYLLAQGDLGHAGVIALRANPWARDMSMTGPEAHAALSELHNERFVVIDQDEMLLLVRSLIRRDGVHKQPNVFKAAVDQIYTTRSMPIRRALLSELERLNPAEFKGDSELLRAEVVAWLKKACENPPPNPSGKGSPKGSEQNGEFGHGFDVPAGEKGSANPSANPQRAHVPADARVSPTTSTTTTPPIELAPAALPTRETETGAQLSLVRGGLPATEPTDTGMHDSVPATLFEAPEVEIPPQRKPEGSKKAPGSRAKSAPKAMTSAPEAFEVTDKLAAWAWTEHKIPRDVAVSQTQVFLDNARAKGNAYKDWTAAWRTWMSRVPIYHPQLLRTPGPSMPANVPATYQNPTTDAGYSGGWRRPSA